MYFPLIPSSFIYKNIELCWRDVLWGYERNLVDWSFIVEVADFFVSKGSVNSIEIDLICLGLEDIKEIEEKMYALAACEHCSHALGSQGKWLFIALKWLYENKDFVADPLDLVELLYEDFDFPVEIESFVRYMPPQDGYDPLQYTVQQNIDRLYCNWRNYLENIIEKGR